MRRPSLAAALAGLAAVGTACADDPRQLVGFQGDSLPVVATAELPDVASDGEPFEFVAPAGGLLVVYFGYTNCPDACPATLVEVKRALDELGDEAADVEVAMVTIDPDRDAGVLAEYVASFVPDAHAVATDDIAALRRFALGFGAEFNVDARAGGNVVVEHTTYLYAVDDQGRLVITWPTETDADDLAADMRQLMDDLRA